MVKLDIRAWIYGNIREEGEYPQPHVRSLRVGRQNVEEESPSALLAPHPPRPRVAPRERRDGVQQPESHLGVGLVAQRVDEVLHPTAVEGALLHLRMALKGTQFIGVLGTLKGVSR